MLLHWGRVPSPSPAQGSLVLEWLAAIRAWIQPRRDSVGSGLTPLFP